MGGQGVIDRLQLPAVAHPGQQLGAARRQPRPRAHHAVDREHHQGGIVRGAGVHQGELAVRPAASPAARRSAA